ncbi:fibronectin type III domain-containing protein [Nonomuraea sp. M3C6]|uniref:Fibronectin type III domain-containing protein n=1 Tax=Nonomuraea marmarensis TaxID=3351344 RepID=A0ABW7ACN5_9ACTN
MSKRLHRIATVLTVVAVTAVLLPSPATAAALSAPERLRVTNVTATQISFAWSQNTSGSVGILRARVYQNGALATTTRLVRHTASGVVPGASYSFHVVAVDDAGNTSPPSRTIAVTTRGPGVVPPGPANLRATEVSPTRVDLAFDQPDDSWDIDHYEFFDGAAVVASIPAYAWSSIPTVTLPLRELMPQSSHSYSVQAVRQALGASPSSNTVTLSTPPRTDLQAPSVPAGLTARKGYACFSVALTWAQSSDNNDPQSAIDYEILVNGMREYWVRGVGTASINTVPVGSNTIAVRAVDSSGNASDTATTTFLRKPTCTDDA